MKIRCRECATGILVAMLISCSGGKSEQPATAIPPAPAAPAGASADAYEVAGVADGGSIAGTVTVSWGYHFK